MAQNVTTKIIECPHCAHHLRLDIDTTQGDQNYYESCPACCRDIHLNMHVDEYYQKIQVMVDADDEQVF